MIHVKTKLHISQMSNKFDMEMSQIGPFQEL